MVVKRHCKSQTMKKSCQIEHWIYQYANQLFDYYICHNANILKGSRQIDCIVHIKISCIEKGIIKNNWKHA